MRCSPEEIRGLARLARLALTDEEVRTAATDLERILGWIGRIEQIEGIEEPGTRDPVPQRAARLREDEPDPWSGRDGLLHGAPEVIDEHLVVPRVVDSEDTR